ncbi:S-adenosyl-L-methionine-dependent methyltransferase [Aspergillus unguis]
MSLYYDASSVLTATSSTGGSFKSRLYNSRTLKASPAQVYALITEASKWDILLKEVIDNAGILKLEPKVLTPLLALLLVHDHLLAKNGIAAPTSHPLRQAIERHKIRLKGEFAKARVRRSCASIPDLKEAVRREKLAILGANGAASAGAVYPRWVRINNVKTTMEEQMNTTFADFTTVDSLEELVVNGDEKQKRVRVDPHIPDLLAVAPGVEFSSTNAYKKGEIILQDKASCFPAYLLLGEDWSDTQGGDLVDGCAAPGNKTTHMASLLAAGAGKKTRKGKSHIFSMDASAVRAKTLQKMVSTAGADNIVTVLQGQDFLALDPNDQRFQDVTGLLLDPSCSGSGIIGRDDVPSLTLPAEGRPQPNQNSKKRKRNEPSSSSSASSKKPSTNSDPSPPSTNATPSSENDTPTGEITHDRLVKLSNLQTLIVTHALSFPSARRITYSTCSIHLLENESVVARVLESDVAKRRGWRVLRRDEQPAGLRKWGARGVAEEKADIPGNPGDGQSDKVELAEEELQGCLRCWPGDEEGTGGFFVVGFVRDGEDEDQEVDNGSHAGESVRDENEDGDEDEWEGFSD